MLASNWTDKYPGEIYRELFRFSKEDFPLLIKSLGIPDVLRLGNGYRTNRSVKYVKFWR
jgi:protoporphyrinogen oxidase